MAQLKTKRLNKSSVDNSTDENLPISPLYMGILTNFCAYTHSRKSISAGDLVPTHADTWYYVTNILKDYGGDHTLISPTPSSTAKANRFTNVYYTAHGVSAPWSGSNLYTKDDFSKKQVFVLDRALETLEDPRYLTRWLRVALKSHPKSRGIIISPDAELNSSMIPRTQLAQNHGHYREWNKERLSQFLLSAGFSIESIHVTPANDCIITVSADEETHRKLIKSVGLPAPRNSLIITTEHADTKSTGGIGSYIKEVETALEPENRPIVLVACAQPFNKIMVTQQKAENIIDIFDIIRRPQTTTHTTEWASASVDIYRAVSELVFIYDQLHIIEFQEYLGIGARLVQAKRAGQVPRDVTCVVRCHGSQVYIDRASFNWSGMEKADVFELERVSINLADEVSFPTKYLRDLYLSTGYDIYKNNSYILRLPYAYPDIPEPAYGGVRKLIFLGKRGIMKGYPSFFSLVEMLTDKDGDLYNSNITEVQIIAAPGDAIDYDEKLAGLLRKRGIKLEIGPLPRHEVLKTIQSSAPHSVVCLPYGNDNHPVTVLEMIANRCRFVAFQTGGIPELIPEQYRFNLTCLADPAEMAKKVNELSMLSTPETSRLIGGLHRAALSEQVDINNHVRDSYLRTPSISNMPIHKNYSSLATVLVPIYNTDLKFVAVVIDCINRQLLAPAEVLFINDKSTSDEYVTRLHELIEQEIKVPYRIIDHKVNLGLAGARNTALAHCKTKYLINIDSDDVVSTSFVFDYIHFMENNSGYSACACALESFTDHDGWNRRPLKSDYAYVGLGDCLVLGVSKNIFGHAGSCVVTEDARRVGGWDATDRSKWEDWAFFLKMTSMGMHIFSFPKVNYYYRITPTSMVRTYADYPAEIRVARNIAGLSIWESHRLYAFIKDEAARTGTNMHNAEPDTLTYRIAKRVAQGINRVPVVKKTTKFIILGGWNTAKKLRGRRS